jgi:hypothetical protein
MYGHPTLRNEQRLIFTRARRARMLLEMRCYAVALVVFATAAVLVVNFAYLID